LTPNAAKKAGAVMLDQRVDLSYDFQVSFDIYLGTKIKGGDGVAFVLQSDPRGGFARGGNGASYGAVGIKNGLGIAFDTLQNKPYGDIAQDHTDFFNTSAPVATSRLSDQLGLGNGNVTDGKWHNVLVSLMVSRKELSPRTSSPLTRADRITPISASPAAPQPAATFSKSTSTRFQPRSRTNHI
jgi:hypothetical protein